MIAYIAGYVGVVTADAIVVITESGVGYTVNVADGSRYTQHERVAMHTSMTWSQEHGPALYGFASRDEVAVFTLLVSCQGVSARMSCTLVGQLGAAAVLHALVAHDSATLSSVRGIGPKRATSLCEHLNERAQALVHRIGHDGASDGNDSAAMRAWSEAHQALQALGYHQREIKQAFDQLRKDGSCAQATAADSIVKQALPLLARSW